MKLRQTPDDFIVEELLDYKESPNGNYALYSLEKKGMESFALLEYISRCFKVKREDIGISGLKDKHAITKQYLTVPKKYGLRNIIEPSFSLKYICNVDKPISLGAHIANKFEITARDVKKGEIDGTIDKARTIAEIGVPNYFDSQRFGSVMNKQFIIKFVMKKNYEAAVKLYCTQYTKFEKRRIKDEKIFFEKNWANFGKLELNIFDNIQTAFNKGGWLNAYKAIPGSMRELYVSVYQSYLWNECLKELLQTKGRRLYTVVYPLGKLRFYKEKQQIPDTFQTIGDRIRPTLWEKDIIDKVLKKEKVQLFEFGIKKETGNYFTSNPRKSIVYPSEFSISKPQSDELNINSYKFVIKFCLPKGSYATIVTKRLFNH